MSDLPGDPNWLLSVVALASTLTLALLAVSVASRGLSTAAQRRALELRRMETGATIRLRILRLNQLETELATLDGSDSASASRRAHASTERELAGAELAELQAGEDGLEAALRDLDLSRRGWFSVLALGYLAVVGILRRWP